MNAGPVNSVAMGFRGFCGFARFVSGVMGADAYRKYLEHHAAVGHDCSGHGGPEHGGPEHGTPPLSEREFWRDRTDRQDNNPQGRCC